MAYTYKLAFSAANRAALLTELWTQLSNAGWTLHDNQDGSSYRVYSSDGESADRITEYMWIDWNNANVVRFRAYYYWNNSTHAGLAYGQSYVDLTTSESTFTVWFFGNKNLFAVYTKISTAWHGTIFGHMPKKCVTTETALTGAETSGSSVTLDVGSTAGFIAGQTYTILGATQEGRDDIVISSITNSTQMVCSNLPRNYSAGSKIGPSPSTFGVCADISGASESWYCTCPRGASGTNNASTTETLGVIDHGLASGDPCTRSGLYYLAALLTYSGACLTAYDDDYCLMGSASNYTAEDIVYIGLQSSGTATSATSTTLVDSGKSWTTDALINKVIVITGGTGAGQVRKITDNDGTSVTVATWDINPSTDSTYVICDECYMMMNAAWAHKIGNV